MCEKVGGGGGREIKGLLAVAALIASEVCTRGCGCLVVHMDKNRDISIELWVVLLSTTVR